MNTRQTVPLGRFPEAWRWSRDRGVEVTEADLARIRPFSSAAAAALWEETPSYSRSMFQPGGELAPGVARYRVGTYGDASVPGWLSRIVPDRAEKVLVIWEPELAVHTDWALFVERWDSFCLPCKDDAWIVPESRAWLLAYHHEDEFFFLRRSPGAQTL
jgi:hypothetical protein